MNRRWIFTAIGALLLIMLGVAASPAVLTRVFAEDSETELRRLSYIGQTYGAASALVASIALVGIVVSIVLQGRESRITRDHALRALHIDLLRLGISDDIYLQCWGGFASTEDNNVKRQHIYVNMILEHWRLMYELGALGERQLNQTARQLLQAAPARRFWAEARAARRAATTSSTTRRFNDLIEEAYDWAGTENSPDTVEASPPMDRPTRRA